jgi:hypothetical protein
MHATVTDLGKSIPAVHLRAAVAAAAEGAQNANARYATTEGYIAPEAGTFTCPLLSST